MKGFVLSLMNHFKIPTKGVGFDFVRNTSWVGFSKIFENIFSYLLIVLISRYLGAEGLGQYSFIFAFTGIFFVFSDWGLSYMMIKDLSRDFSNVNKYVNNILTLKSLLLVLSFLIYFVALFFIDKDYLFSALLIAGLLSAVKVLGSLFFNLLRIKHKGKFIALSNFLERFIALVLGGFVLIFYKSLMHFIVCLLISQLVRFIMLFVYSKKYFSYEFSLNWPFLFDLIKRGYPFLLITAFSIIYVQMDSIMLSFIKSDLITGWYNAPYKLINVLNVVPALLLTFGFPLFSKFYKENKSVLRVLLEKILYYSTIFIMPIIVGVFFLAHRILEFIYDFNSIQSAVAFKILIIAELFVFLTTILGQFIAACDKQKVFMKIAGLGAIVNIILNFLLIPKYSLYGAGVATLTSYFLMFLAMYFFINKNLVKISFFKRLLVPIIASILMGIVLSNILFLNLLLIIFICAIVYFLIIVILEELF